MFEIVQSSSTKNVNVEGKDDIENDIDIDIDIDIVRSSLPENVHVEERGALELEHQEQRVENDQEQDEVLKRRRSNQPPDVIPTHQGQSKLRYLCLCCSRLSSVLD